MNRIATALEGILAFLKGTKITVAATSASPPPADKAPAATTTKAPKDKTDTSAKTTTKPKDAPKDTKGDAGATKPAYTQDQVREIVKRLAADDTRGGRDAALKILADVGGGAKAVKYLEPKYFDAVYDATEAVLDADIPANEDDPTADAEEDDV